MKTLLIVKLHLHETDLLFRYLCHHLTWHCSSISEDLHRCDHKIVFEQFYVPNNFVIISVQIFINHVNHVNYSDFATKV